MKGLFLISISLFLASTHLHAKETLPLKVGFWEMTDQITLDQAEIDKMMEQVPKEAQAQVKAMMKQQGLGSESEAYQNCVTKEDLEKGLFNQGDQCVLKQTSKKGNHYNYSVKCEDPKAEGKLKLTINGEKQYQSDVDMNVTDQGETKNIKITSKGKWLQKECPKES